MSLAAGTRLGPYEVLGLIGAGGMGEVYKAHDTRLDRTVAIKVLPADISADPDRRARFEREAKTIAGLDHPHICTLHDVGEHEGSMFLVMEHLDGETLAHRIEKGPLPIDQALTIAIDIADALSAAHRHGVVHRDLKPGNVMLTKTGAKLLDFGLAKLTGHGEQAAAGQFVSMPTRTAPLTGEGVIVGTLQYMAPEQLEGRPADARTDLWALGSILYEMVAGKRAFEGASGASLIAAILEREPAPLGAIEPLTPPGLDRLVRTCLAKEPDRRFHSAHDVALEIRWLREATVSPAASAPATAGLPRPRWGGVLLGALGGALVAAAAVWTWTASPPSAQRAVVRFAFDVPTQRRLGGLAMSPDGMHVVYVGVEGDKSMLFRRSRDQFTQEPIPGTEGGLAPFFSPDGQWLAFFRAQRLLKVRLDGRDLTSICGIEDDTERASAQMGLAPRRERILYSGTWGEDGTIVYSAGYSHLWRVSSAGSAPAPVTRLDPERGELAHIWPVLLPGAKTVLYSVLTGMIADVVTAMAVSLEDGRSQVVLPNARAATFVRGGHVLYADRDSLVAVRFAPDRLEVSGTPVPMVDELAYTSPVRVATWWLPLFAVSSQGDLAYASSQHGERSELLRVTRDGRSERIAELPPGFGGAMSISPDGRRLLLNKGERGRSSVWMVDLQRGALGHVEDRGNAHAPIWSPDGLRLAFSSVQGGAANVFVRDLDGTGAPERLVTSRQHQDPGTWSRDGRWLAYAAIDPRTGWDLWALDLTTRSPVQLRQTRSNEHHPAFSPDGRWVAYVSDETGRDEVYVQAFPGGAPRQQVSVAGGTEPLWRYDGAELYFRSGTQVMVLPVRNGVPSSTERALNILEGPFKPSGVFGPAGYAVAPDGRQFYVTRAIALPPMPQQIRVVLGWAQEVAEQLGK